MTSKIHNADSTLDAGIRTLTLAKDVCAIPPAHAAFGSASTLLTLIRDTAAKRQDYVELGLACADVCVALDRGLGGKRFDELNNSVLKAIERLSTTVAGIQRRIIERGNRSVFFRVFHVKNDKNEIVSWRQDFNNILQIFNTELAINTHVLVADLHRRGQESTVGQPTQVKVSGELPPPPPSACFGRSGLIEEILGFVENLESIALIGAGGIGKTSVALAVLHDERIRARFGDNRRFIRCDQFPASRLHFLARISQVIGAGIENLENLTPLRPFLSSKEMILFLDNAESILDPQGADAREIYALVGELSRFGNICIGITSRITTVPPKFKRPAIPTLSMESACDIFYAIYNDGGRSRIISDLVNKLDYHALSITLLATTASHNMWDYDRLAKEWNTGRAQVLRTDYNESLAAAVELSLASPTFDKLGSNARELLGIIAFFPQGIYENNIDWLFPTVSDRRQIFDKFCVLSLTSRSRGFITMLAPIRDYLCPRDPNSSPLLCATRDHYFRRLSVPADPGQPGFEGTRWIISEDVNVEHLLDVLTSMEGTSDDIWEACSNFLGYVYWHKPRETMLRPKIEALPDGHPFKPDCLTGVSRLFERVGKQEERKRLLTHALKLYKERGNCPYIARTLRFLSDANRLLEHYEEGIRQAEEALGILEWLGDTIGQAVCSVDLGELLLSDGHFDAAEDIALHTIDLVSGQGGDFTACRSHRILGDVYQYKGEKEKAIKHFEMAFGIAKTFNWEDQLFLIHYKLGGLFLEVGEFGDAQAHVEQAISYATGETPYLGYAVEMQARIWHRQGRLEDARSGLMRAIELYEKLGLSRDAEGCRDLLQDIEEGG